ncbi:hypothetical protein [Bacillus cereus]|uniref:hypothetical protein n=1 Tax=Bacillus cereus TaxID=1396 RepID=UPI00148311E8|nr:hypothetical protein [Bacillus cereus]
MKMLIISAIVTGIIQFFVKKMMDYIYPVCKENAKTALLRCLKWAVRKLEN